MQESDLLARKLTLLFTIFSLSGLLACNTNPPLASDQPTEESTAAQPSAESPETETCDFEGPEGECLETREAACAAIDCPDPRCICTEAQAKNTCTCQAGDAEETARHPFDPGGELTLPRLTPEVIVVSAQVGLPGQWPTAETISSELQVREPVEISENEFVNSYRETKLPAGPVPDEDYTYYLTGSQANDLSLLQGLFAEVVELLEQRYGAGDFEQRVDAFSCLMTLEDGGTDILTCYSPPTSEGAGPQAKALVLSFAYGNIPPWE